MKYWPISTRLHNKPRRSMGRTVALQRPTMVDSFIKQALVIFTSPMDPMGDGFTVCQLFLLFLALFAYTIKRNCFYWRFKKRRPHCVLNWTSSPCCMAFDNCGDSRALAGSRVCSTLCSVLQLGFGKSPPWFRSASLARLTRENAQGYQAIFQADWDSQDSSWIS